MMQRRTFILRRDTDVTKVSGTGDIAEGVQFENGVVVLAWRPQVERGAQGSVAVWPDLDSMVGVHGHDGATRVVWDDEDAAWRQRFQEGARHALGLGGDG